MPNIERLQRDIIRAENNVEQMKLLYEIAKLDRKLVVLNAVRKVCPRTDQDPPQTA